MAGRWKGGKFERVIEKSGGLEWILEQVSSGHSLRAVAREIGCSRWWLDRWIYADSERRERALRARVAGSSVRAEEALALLLDPSEAEAERGGVAVA